MRLDTASSTITTATGIVTAQRALLTFSGTTAEKRAPTLQNLPDLVKPVASEVPAAARWRSSRANWGAVTSAVELVITSAGSGEAGSLSSQTGAMNRYPRLGTVSTNWGASVLSPRAFRISRMYFLRTSGFT